MIPMNNIIKLEAFIELIFKKVINVNKCVLSFKIYLIKKMGLFFDVGKANFV